MLTKVRGKRCSVLLNMLNEISNYDKSSHSFISRVFFIFSSLFEIIRVFIFYSKLFEILLFYNKNKPLFEIQEVPGNEIKIKFRVK